MPETGSTPQPVIVVGGGWAGLAAALTLCRHRVPVTLLESARQLGGRARSVRIDDTVLDNGQHLMIGAYQSMLTLMADIGVDLDEAFQRLPLTLQLRDGEKTGLDLRARRLPAPLHLLGALVTAHGLSPADKWRALRFARHLPDIDITADRDISVQALLHSEAQPPALIRKLWEPLCVAALNTPPAIASARLFVNVLRITFGKLNRHADLLIPRLELSELLPRPGAAFLERHGSHIEIGQRVSAIRVEENRIRSVTVGERILDAGHVILATPPTITRRLITREPALKTLACQLAELGNEPVSTVYIQYPAGTRLPLPVIGLEDSLVQWVFDRRVCAQPGLMAVVISARGEHSRMPADTLADSVTAELARCFPDWPPPLGTRLIREKRATFCARAGIDTVRPDNRTPVEGLWLAGDYTGTGLPATLEGAVRSGISCAQAVLRAVTS